MVLRIKLCVQREKLATMSPKMAMLIALVSSEEVKKIVQLHGSVALIRVNDGDAPLALCDSKKALSTVGLLRAGQKYFHHEAYKSHVAIFACSHYVSVV